MKVIKKASLAVALAATFGVAVGVPSSYAALTADSELTQEVTAGTLSTSVRDASGAVVASPSFGMSSTVASSTAAATSTGTFGTNAQRISVDNPGGANSGWTLALSGTGTWTSGSDTYPFNAATGPAGQLTVDPSVATLTPVTPSSGGTTGVTLGTSGTFNTGVSSIDLITAAASSADVWNGYITGVGLSQTVPSGTPVGNYSLTVTQTVAAS